MGVSNVSSEQMTQCEHLQGFYLFFCQEFKTLTASRKNYLLYNEKYHFKGAPSAY